MNENKLHMVNKLIQKDGVCNTFLDDVKIYKTLCASKWGITETEN